MLKRIKVQGFKTLWDEEPIELPHLTVIFGPNASGKSNFLEALQVLSRTATERTLSEAFACPIRGHAIEAFRFPSTGLPGLYEAEQQPTLTLEADVELPSRSEKSSADMVRYRIKIGIHPSSGVLSVIDEYLVEIKADGTSIWTPKIDSDEHNIYVRKKKQPGHPLQEEIGQGHTVLSNPRYAGEPYSWIERTRDELRSWRVYYLDPRVAMREAKAPSEVLDIGELGDYIAPFLHRLSREYPKNFEAVRRTLSRVIPSVEGVSVDLDPKRGTLDIQVRQGGVDYSSRIISEGTLRVLALVAITVNPWRPSLIAFEEPENGVHPRRLELIAELLYSLADSQCQVIVTTHSPLFCDWVLRKQEEPSKIGVFTASRRDDGSTRLRKFDPLPLFQGGDVRDALSTPTEDGMFENLVLRGFLNEE